jgi:hypothetical protein
VKRYLDSVGVFTRDIGGPKSINEAWSSLALEHPRRINRPDALPTEASAQLLQTWEGAHKPGRILYPFNSFPHNDPQPLAEVDKFLEKPESFTGIKPEVIDLEQS